jgi:hypothetical protein
MEFGIRDIYNDDEVTIQQIGGEGEEESLEQDVKPKRKGRKMPPSSSKWKKAGRDPRPANVAAESDY